MYDIVIIGGGIVGLATAMTLAQRYPHTRLCVLEKEPALAAHQTGRNSGVIHSGVYYKPGSLKARFARDGNRALVEFCQRHGIQHEICGKVIVATSTAELSRLDQLYARGLANGLTIRKIDRAELRAIEPHVAGVAALHVPGAGIVDYRQVAHTYARLFQEQGGELRLNTRVESLNEQGQHISIGTSKGEITTRLLVNCAGLYSDRIARLHGVATNARIVPFRGEYYELKPDKRYLVRNLIYPVPNPSFPFLGVHFTRMIGGDVHAGPNAVLSLKREGYTRRDVNGRDLLEVLTYPGFWRLARKHWRDGLHEIVRSFSKRAFVHSLQQLIPSVHADDLLPSAAGVRAQALLRDGALVDDFLIVVHGRALHVLNAPSPAATASLQIGQAIADRVRTLSPDIERIVVA